MYYIIPINKKRKEREGEGKEREKSFLFCLYDSAINIRIITYLLTNKKRKGRRRERKGKIFFALFV